MSSLRHSKRHLQCRQTSSLGLSPSGSFPGSITLTDKCGSAWLGDLGDRDDDVLVQ